MRANFVSVFCMLVVVMLMCIVLISGLFAVHRRVLILPHPGHHPVCSKGRAMLATIILNVTMTLLVVGFMLTTKCCPSTSHGKRAVTRLVAGTAGPRVCHTRRHRIIEAHHSPTVKANGEHRPQLAEAIHPNSSVDCALLMRRRICLKSPIDLKKVTCDASAEFFSC
jgi:hypothetical protein